MSFTAFTVFQGLTTQAFFGVNEYMYSKNFVFEFA